MTSKNLKIVFFVLSYVLVIYYPKIILSKAHFVIKYPHGEIFLMVPISTESVNKIFNSSYINEERIQ